ncbi:hypothetical protein AJ87_27575 [Rhizobium yanglingense]|nr:hypothetical protein AJ87_27575 [Rhizobium yanglingense]
MARSVWKGPFVDGYLLKKAEKVREGGRAEVIKIWSRRSTILPQFVGLTFGSTTAASMFRSASMKTWSVTNSVNSLRPGPITVTVRTRRQRGSNNGQGKSRTPAEGQRGASSRPTLRVSPQKLNLVAAAIRGKKVDRALAELEFSRKRIAGAVKKTLESAIANAENNHDLDVDSLVVAEAYVGKSIVMKRFHARGRGRASRIEKPFAHLTIVVREVQAQEEAA